MSTPCGIRSLLANVWIATAEEPKVHPKAKNAELEKARALLYEVGQTEN